MNLEQPKPNKTISWQPIQKEGKALTNMELKNIEGSLEFHLSVVSRLFYFSFIVLGSFFIFYATYALLSYHFHATFWSVLLGFSLTGVGIYMFSKQAIPRVFNKKENIFFKENENLEKDDETALNEVEALQIVSYVQESEGKKEKQADLNLVLNNGNRVYVCSYDANAYEQIKQDAKTISEYINKPIWDGFHSKQA